MCSQKSGGFEQRGVVIKITDIRVTNRKQHRERKKKDKQKKTKEHYGAKKEKRPLREKKKRSNEN